MAGQTRAPLRRRHTGSPRLRVVPPCDDRPERGPGDLGHEPRVDLGCAVIGRRHDPEFREQPASLGIVVLEEDLVGNQPTVLLDGFHGRRANVADPGWERLGNPLLDQADGIQGTIGYAASSIRSITACPGSRKRMARTRSAALASPVSISNVAEFIATPPPGTPRGDRTAAAAVASTVFRRPAH